ncbi:hypothetical protein [Tenacibaculum xiamenense]|uniref:hypothetical protein n=1 Tax=Tenacibaculum xiamenense TaxID=1261553 RepID=UPI0038B60378
MDHFSFKDAYALKEEGGITDTEAHTGRKSIEVKPSKSVSLIKKLNDVNPDLIEDCVDEPNGDITITDGGTPADISCGHVRAQRTFIISGSPNSQIPLIITGTIDQQSTEGVLMSVAVDDNVIINRYLLDTGHLQSPIGGNINLGSKGKAVITVVFCPILCELGEVKTDNLDLTFTFGGSAQKRITESIECVF